MKRTTIMIIALALLAAPLTGCIENMRDLKDRVTPAATEDVETPPAVEQNVNTTNVTKKLKAPIARASIYGESGALMYKATFVAEDMMSPLRVDEGKPITLNGVDSETQEPGATIAKYTWTLGDETLEGRNVILTPTTPGVHPLVLVVTDSNGETDNQTVMLGIAPAPFDVTLEVTAAGPIAGVAGNGQAGTAAFSVVDEVDGMVVTAVAAKVVATFGKECDGGVEVLDAEGKSLGRADSMGHTDPDQSESLSLGALVAGAYTARAYGYACADADGVPVTIIITYVPILEGLPDDGHGAHAH